MNHQMPLKFTNEVKEQYEYFNGLMEQSSRNWGIDSGIGRAAAGQDAPPVGASLRPCPWGPERRYEVCTIGAH